MQGESVEIISPASLRQQMGQWFANVANMYLQETEEKT